MEIRPAFFNFSPAPEEEGGKPITRKDTHGVKNMGKEEEQIIDGASFSLLSFYGKRIYVWT